MMLSSRHDLEMLVHRSIESVIRCNLEVSTVFLRGVTRDPMEKYRYPEPGLDETGLTMAQHVFDDRLRRCNACLLASQVLVSSFCVILVLMCFRELHKLIIARALISIKCCAF